jgi:hypothetical protein
LTLSLVKRKSKTGPLTVKDHDDNLTAIEVAISALQGAIAPSNVKYLHTQSSDSDTWTVNHNLGARPLLLVYSVGWVEVDASVTHVSDNQSIVQFNTAQSGFAVCQ